MYCLHLYNALSFSTPHFLLDEFWSSLYYYVDVKAYVQT